MSFPNIPDINPEINISFEDAINLLLISIAMEEISLSKMLDAETNKILSLLENKPDFTEEKNSRGYNEYSTQDMLAINKSVNDTIKNMIKLQMLLQFKLENVKEILPKTNETFSSTTTSTSTTSSSTSTFSTTTASTKTYAPVSTTTISKATTSTTTYTTSTTIAYQDYEIFKAYPICRTKLNQEKIISKTIMEEE